MFKRIFKLMVVLSVLMVNSFVYAQDDNIPPQFIFNQSQNQGGYLFLSADFHSLLLVLRLIYTEFEYLNLQISFSLFNTIKYYVISSVEIRLEYKGKTFSQ